MRLATATKVRLAGVLYRAVRLVRRLSGRTSDRVTCKRGDLVWALDLQDGIQLSIYLFGAFEGTTARGVERLLPVGGVAIDVGANIGAQTLPMARRAGDAGRVIAIEPTAAAVQALRRNVALNPQLTKTISVYAAALVAPGESVSREYYSSWPVTHADQPHAIHRGVLKSAEGSAAFTLDELVTREGLSRLDVVKIDVDGREVRVLRGAGHTLATLRPSFVLELAPYALEECGDSLDSLIHLLRDAGYRFVAEGSFARLPDDAKDLARLIPPAGSINVVALPVERSVN
jgi:FkbM family methyltransferase